MSFVHFLLWNCRLSNKYAFHVHATFKHVGERFRYSFLKSRYGYLKQRQALARTMLYIF